MSAPLGNKHAERWTREKTIDKLTRMEKFIDINQPLFLGEALAYVGLYADIWRYWKEKWEDDEEIYDRIMLMTQRFENRLLKASMRQEVHPGTAMFVLRCHYGYLPAKSEKTTPADMKQTPAPQRETAKQEPLIDRSRTNIDENGVALHMITPDMSRMTQGEPCGPIPTVTEAGSTGSWIRLGDNQYFQIG